MRASSSTTGPRRVLLESLDLSILQRHKAEDVTVHVGCEFADCKGAGAGRAFLTRQLLTFDDGDKGAGTQTYSQIIGKIPGRFDQPDQMCNRRRKIFRGLRSGDRE